MADWLSKEISSHDCPQVQEAFTRHFRAQGEPRDFALFIRPHTGTSMDTLLVPPGHEAIADELAPGGWRVCERPSEGGWRIAAGHSDAILWFRLPM